MTNENEIYQDAVEAIRMSGGIDFEEWYPAWMIDERGELIRDDKRLEDLRVIWDKANKRK